jgi:hypothetical protein
VLTEAAACMVPALSTADVTTPLGFLFPEFHVCVPEGFVVAGRGARGAPGGISLRAGGAGRQPLKNAMSASAVSAGASSAM